VPLTALPAALLLLGLALLVLATLARVRRLHRLHQRLDAARAGLDAALVRRARAAAAAGLREPADAALARSGRPWTGDREDAENALGAALAALDRRSLPAAVRHELADAEQLAALGRAVHNDAVRDALALRTRRLVRLLRLAGTAPPPLYAEFAVPPAGVIHVAAGERPADVGSRAT
jgi:hypothetical protein